MKQGLIAVVNVVARAGKEDELRAGFKELVEYAKTEPGFIQYDLHESIEQPGHFVFYEIWENQEALDVHANTDFAKAFSARAGQWIESVSMNKFRNVA
ncbi:antibiotic biosynthesis monooxygenase [Paraburkholderia bannensis]|jgi:quinol monooxygenase YgiN|nr:putative quinol monooxygenase [Paraburkholderia bannensis]RQM47168.1 antibiotic biosynthesis monooxygenase [Paraburkholderia bannensis]